jgi:hypothetical protein
LSNTGGASFLSGRFVKTRQFDTERRGDIGDSFASFKGHNIRKAFRAGMLKF